MLTFAAVAVALWPIVVQWHAERARAGHLVRTIALLLIAFVSAFEADLEENDGKSDLVLSPPQRGLLDDILRIYEEAFVITHPKLYGPMASILGEMLVLRSFDSVTKDTGMTIVGRIKKYLSGQRIGVEVTAALPASWAALRNRTDRRDA